MKSKEKLFLAFVALLVVVSIVSKAYIFEWDWRCVVTECRLVKGIP